MQNPFTTTFSKTPEYTYIHTDKTEEILEELSKKLSKDRLTVWLPYENESSWWVKVPFVDKASAELAKQYGKLGVWILSKEAELRDAEELGADIIETVGTLKPKRI
mgnify:CR=1 FL=1